MFCQKCGTELPETSSFCISCGAAVVPIEPPAPAPSSFSIYVGTVFKYIGGIFKSPAKNFQRICEDKTPIWVVYESVKYFVIFIGILLLTLGAKQDWVGASNICNMITDGALCDNFGMKLLFSMLIYGFTTGTQVLTAWVASAKMSKNSTSFITVLNICSISGFVIVPFILAAIVCAFLWYPLALLLLAIGLMATIVMYLEGTHAAGIFGENTMWKNLMVISSSAAIFTFLTILFMM